MVAERFRKSGYNKLKLYTGFIDEWSERDELPMQHMERYRHLVSPSWVHSLIKGEKPDYYTNTRYLVVHAHYRNRDAYLSGHIPGAKNVPWSRAINPDDGTFKTSDELRAIYEQEQGLSPDDEVVVYCRIGERSSHTWFVLTYLLGYNQVRNYDGSWTEWGNLVNVPIER